jgi:hypothetical protein
MVGRYPVDVSKSRRHDWWRVTGWAGRWLIPDFGGVAADYDAVHLSIAGYLTTAGRALSVDDARTVLAGWDPDQTFWLTEVLTSAGPPNSWVDLDDGRLGWTLSGAGPASRSPNGTEDQQLPNGGNRPRSGYRR